MSLCGTYVILSNVGSGVGVKGGGVMGGDVYTMCIYSRLLRFTHRYVTQCPHLIYSRLLKYASSYVYDTPGTCTDMR